MNRNRHIGIYLKSVALVGGLLFFACTQDEEIATNKLIKSDIVTFGFGASNEWKPDVVGDAVSSRSRTQALPMDCEGGTLPDEIYMYMLEEDCPTEVDTVSVNSRSAEGEETTSAPNIGIFAFQVPGEESANAMTYDPQDCSSVLMNNINYTTYTNNVYWPGGGYWLQFYAYQPYCGTVEGLTLTSDSYNPTFTYNVPTDVTQQSDLMVGSPSAGMLYGTYCQDVEIELNHILSNIRVKAGNIQSNAQIKAISFEGIKNTATYSFVDATWKFRNDSPTTEVYSQGDPNTKNTYLSINETDKMIAQPFKLLPQTLSDDAEIKIVLDVTTPNPNSTGDTDKNRTDTYTLTKKLNAFKAEWSKNKQYTYVITTPQHVDVEVTDEVEGNVKKDLVIKNTGMSPAYIRAAIVGNWVRFENNVTPNANEYEEILENKSFVAEWNEKDFGTFDWGLGEGNEHQPVQYLTHLNAETWVKDTDGYFYYTGIVKPGEKIPVPLFNTYTLDRDKAPSVDAYLELIVAVQAVYPEDVDLLWNSDVKLALEMLKDEIK